MKRNWKTRSALFALMLLCPIWAFATEDKTRAKTDKEIKQILIQASIRSYSGSCPCPYNKDRAGRRCGGRSAYSRPGGASPLCYAHERVAEDG